MSEVSEGRFQQYLAAKRTVDDRALDSRVLDCLRDELAAMAVKTDDRPLCVLNVGAGIGTVLERLLDRDILPESVEYTLLDIREANIETARERLPRWATTEGCETTETDTGFCVVSGDRRVTVEFVVADAFEYIEGGTWDVLIGQAFLDLFDTRRAFDILSGALAPGGIWYFPITFDGGTVFEPAVDAALDARIERAYHDHIDDGGDSHAGRHLLAHACETSEVLAAAGSDWVIHPHTGEYPDDEAFFLRYILDTVTGALCETGKFDSMELTGWAAARHRQLDRGELVYVAHQLDVLGRVSDGVPEDRTDDADRSP